SPRCLSCVDASRSLHSPPTRRSTDLSDAHSAIQKLNDRYTDPSGGRAAGAAAAAPTATSSTSAAAATAATAATPAPSTPAVTAPDRKSTRLNSSHVKISYAVFCLTKK